MTGGTTRAGRRARRARRRPAVPVLLVAGFLGTGKTTLLNHLLRNTVGARIGVVVNDFGAINIDALLVAGQADGAVSLGNGCMCCSTDADGLGEALGRLAAPAADLDAVIIEASGIAEPRTLIRLVTAVADPAIRYGGLIYLVDASSFDEIRGTHPEIDRHVGLADLVVVNKTDLLDADGLAAIEATVAELNPTAPAVLTRESRIPPELLFETAQRQIVDDDGPRQLSLDELLAVEGGDGAHDEHDDHGHSGYAPGGHAHDHLHDRYDSVSVTYPRPLDPRRLAGFLERPPEGTYRIKGVVAFGTDAHRDVYAVHAVGGFVRTELVDEAAMPSDSDGDSDAGGASVWGSVVVLGAGIDTEQVRAALHGLEAQPDLGDEYGILGITRHLPGNS